MTWTCPACGGENPEGMRFCGHCGTPRAAPAPAEEPTSPGSGVEAPTPGAAAPGLSAEPPGVPPSDPAAAPSPTTDVAPPERVEDERRLITALFADISGFTTLADRVDTETLLEIIDPIVNRLAEVVARYEGHVEKFAGDAVLALFGAPIAHEDDASRALAVALEMHREVEGLRKTLPADAGGLALHIGVNSGHGIARMLGSGSRMDYAVMGDAVIVAQRLESVAPTGETFVGEATVELARDRFEFEDLGELSLKGKVEPVRAWRLVAERSPAGRDEPPERRARRLLGREAELDRLAASLPSPAGPGALLAILGEPGVGKSTLIRAVRDIAVGSGMTWLETRCLAYGAAIAYRPFAELVQRAAGIQLDDLADVARAVLAAYLDAVGYGEARPFFARLLGIATSGADDVSGLEPEAFRNGLHAAVAGWLHRLAEAAPVIVHVEDLHWADTASLDLLGELASLASSRRIALAMTARDEAGEAVRSLVAAGMGAPSVVLELGPLDRGATTRLVAEVLGRGDPPERLVDAVVDRTGGNPFFVEETVRRLIDDGSLAWDPDGGWRLPRTWDAASVPPTVEGVLAARIDRLPARAAEAIQVAAAIGRRVRGPLLRAVDTDPGLDGAIDRLVGAGFLDRGDGRGHEMYVFHHALVQDVAYGRLLRRRRRDLHRRIAAAAEALYGTGDDAIDLLARHLYLAEAGTKAVEYLVRAGERARRLFANDEAITAYERAIEAAGPIAAEGLPAGRRIDDLRLALADLLALRGRNDEALALYRGVAAAAGSVRAWSGAGLVLVQAGAYEEALGLAGEASASLAAGPAATAADVRPVLLVRARALRFLGRNAEALATVEDGLAAGSAPDLLRGQLLLEGAWATAVAGADGIAIALERTAEAYGIFETLGDLRRMVTADQARGEFLRLTGELPAAAAVLERGLANAVKVGSSEETAGCLDNLAFVETEQGRYEAALAYLDAAISEHRRTRRRHGLVFAMSNRAETLMRMGRADDARTEALAALRLAREIGNAMVVADALETLSRASSALGEDSAAAAYADEATEAYVAIGESPAALKAAEMAAAGWTRAGMQPQATASASRARSLARPGPEDEA